jgi:hypothetical protein
MNKHWKQRADHAVVLAILLCSIEHFTCGSSAGDTLSTQTAHVAHVKNERELQAALRDDKIDHVELLANITMTRRVWKGEPACCKASWHRSLLGASVAFLVKRSPQALAGSWTLHK